MNYRFQQICALSGIALVFVVFPLLIVMGFFPPPSPAEGASAIAAHYQSKSSWIFLLGGAVCVQMSAPGVMWSAVVSVQLRHIEGNSPPIFSLCQMACGIVAFSVFTFACAGWVICAFRPERAPAIIQTLNDWSFIVFLGTVTPLMGQALTIGMAIFSDQSDEPVFPRWAGFFNCWVAMIFLPAGLIPFFKSGPFAWHGFFGLWLPVLVFGGWMLVMSVLVLRAIKKQRIAALALSGQAT
jgi:hypothetical protein|tara:strand:+ start:139 stop:858 length:720 start_codon:yes stop_codon:yes gene_type:complete